MVIDMADYILNHLHFMVYVTVFGPMAAALPCWITGLKSKLWRDCFVFVVCGLEFACFLFMFVLGLNGIYGDGAVIPAVCGMGLRFSMDGFRILYGTITAFMWFMTAVFSREYFAHYRNRNRYYFFFLITLGATEGVFLSQDFFTIFIFFEIMSLTSFAWVAHDEKSLSIRAAYTYLAVAVIGGLVMLMGLFLYYFGGAGMKYAAGLCMLAGFGAKAGAFPLHIWLPKAHSAAPAPASALLSGVLTKTGVFGILMLTTTVFGCNMSWGTLVLVLGVVTMALGALLALFSMDLKRTLACSSVSQIGFVLVGIGMSGLMGTENAIAVRGAVLHMVNHSCIKLALFMAAGVVYMNLHKLDINDIRGFGRKKPLLNYIFIMGALGICGIPFWNGYVSKTLIHESIVEFTGIAATDPNVGAYICAGAIKAVEWIFLVSGGLTVAYMTKLYVAVFVERNADENVQGRFDALGGKYMNKISGAVLAVSATILPVMGCMPGMVMGKLADMGQSFALSGTVPTIGWFLAENLKGALISVIIGIAVYVIVVRTWMMKADNGVRIYVNRWRAWLDLENTIYRPVLFKALPFMFGVICRILDSGVDAVVVFLRKTVYKDSGLPYELEEGNRFTHWLGGVCNRFQEIGNRSFWKEHPRNVDYIHRFALLYQELYEDTRIIGRSLSFGLLLFCVGLMLTVVYLLVA